MTYCRLKTVSNTKGALLLEILLAIVIMSVSLGVIIQAMTGSLRAARYAAQYTQAVIAADAQMTTLIKDKRFKDAPFVTGEEGARENGANIDFSVETEASQESSDLETVRLRTEWQTGRKTNRLEISTYSRVAP